MERSENSIMKNHLYAVILCLAMIGLCLFTGCESGTGSGEIPKITASPENAVFREDGSSDFVIIRSDNGKGAAVDAAISLKKQMKEDLGKEIRLATDFLKAGVAEYTENEFEILVGETNREASAMFDGDALRCRDWAVGRDGGKIVIAGGDAIADAVSFFLNDMNIDGNLYIPDGYRYVYRAEYAFDGLTIAGKPLEHMTIVHDGGAEASAAANAFAEFVVERFGFRLPVENQKQYKGTDGCVTFLNCASDLTGQNVCSADKDGLTVTCGLFGSVEDSLLLLESHISACDGKTPEIPDGFLLTKEGKRDITYTVSVHASKDQPYTYKTGEEAVFAVSLLNGADPVRCSGFAWTMMTGSGKIESGTSDTADISIRHTFEQPEFLFLTVSAVDGEGKPIEGIAPAAFGAGADIALAVGNEAAEKRTDIDRADRKDIDTEEKDTFFSQRKINVVGSENDPIHHIYQLADNGLMVRYADFEAKKPGEPISILQITDMHLNRINNKDKEEALPCIESTREFRKWCANEASAPNAKRCMAIAKYFDQTVVTGDTVDYLTWGTLDLTREVIWDVDPEAIVTLGGHDTTRVMQGQVADTTSYQSRLDILQEAWAHDILYYSRIIDDRVMVIQMDNGNGGYSPAQAAKLARDIQTCRDENLIAFIFQHEPLGTNNPADRDNTPIRVNDGSGTNDYCSAFRGSNENPDKSGVYSILTSSADVVKGVFCGHMHRDQYSEILAVENVGGELVDTVIPQYTLTGSPYDMGHVLIINVK